MSFSYITDIKMDVPASLLGHVCIICTVLTISYTIFMNNKKNWSEKTRDDDNNGVEMGFKENKSTKLNPRCIDFKYQ